MTWTRINDTFIDDPRLITASRSARLLHVEGLVWANKHTTDGFIPGAALRRLTDSEAPTADADQLVASGLWEPVEDGWQIDWADQMGSAEVAANRARNAARQRAFRERRQLHADGDHSKCHPYHCPTARNALRNGPTNGVSNDGPSRPVPSRPVGEGQGQGQGQSAGTHSVGRADARPPLWSPPPVVQLVDGGEA